MKINKQLATLVVNKNDDYYSSIVKTLEENGFIIILTLETSFEKHYIIAKEAEE